MSGERFEAALNEDRRVLEAVDRELRDLLAIEPSQGFQAQVRRRIAETPVSRHGWLWWPAFSTALLAAVTMAILGGLHFRRMSSPSRVQHTATIVRGAEPPRSQPGSPHVDERRAHSSAARMRVVKQVVLPSHDDSGPEVLVPSEREDAIRRLVKAVAAGRLQSAREVPLAPVEQPGLVPLTVAPISVTPVELPETVVRSIGESAEGVNRD